MEWLNYDCIVYQIIYLYYMYILGIKDNLFYGGINKINFEEYNIYLVDIYLDSLVFVVNYCYIYIYLCIDMDKEGQFFFY